jgi:DNA-binding MarR family transcriptional regulator
VLQNLIERGLVRRERSAEDRPEYVLELGPDGQRARGRVEKLSASWRPGCSPCSTSATWTTSSGWPARSWPPFDPPGEA